MNDLSPVKRALVEIERLQQEVDSLRQQRHEPLAIVGMACRFPGGVVDPPSFWSLLEEGREGIIKIPPERWDIDALFHPDPTHAGSIASRWGGFLDAIDQFDPGFFGISPREAVAMDPQQRLLLEVVWEGLETAGLTADEVRGTATGVFVGVCSSDYERLHYRDPATIDFYSGTGSVPNAIAGRLAYVFDLHGPALVVDTACSSSLVAVHLASQSLRNGECDLALAAGVNLFILPERHICASRMQMLAPDGRCKTFDARADGFVRSEGCGVVLIKRLSDALAAGDPIRALIRGSAINQDGRTVGLTAPNVHAQRSVLQQALANARVDPGDVTFIETHGAGTSLGDPIEVEALASVYGQPSAAPCTLGAVKTNIGHTEAAAGIASVIKTVLALEHAVIPGNLHFERLNPSLPLAGTRLRVAATPCPWPRGNGSRLAAVSSFGWSGTNAHVVLEEAPGVASHRGPADAASDGCADDDMACSLLPISARSRGAARELATRYAARLTSRERVADLVATAAVHRTHHRVRLAAVGTTAAELAADLERLDVDEPVESRGVVFVYPGQGGQWPGMGRELYAREPVFRRAVDACRSAIRAERGWDLGEAIASGAVWDDIERTQPALFAVSVGLTALLRHWGVEPAAVVGHSLGEVAAAHVAGALTLADAVTVMCTRSRLLARLRGGGAMAFVELSREEADAALGSCAGRVSVAAVNGPRAVVVSGDRERIEALLEDWQRQGVFCRRVQVDVASHSAQVDPLLSELRSRLASVRPRAATPALLSTVTAGWVNGQDLDGDYWTLNLRSPVRFADAISATLAAGYRIFVELGPHPVLVDSIRDILARQPGVALGSLSRDEPERQTLLRTAGTLYQAGADLAWANVNPPGRLIVDAPTYAWQHARYWLDDQPRAPSAASRDSLSIAGQDGLYMWRFDVEQGHRVNGREVMSTAGYVERVLDAARERLTGPWELTSMRLLSFLERSHETQLVMQASPAGARVGVWSRSPGSESWHQHMSGQLAPLVPPDPAHVDLDAIRARCPRTIGATDFYNHLAAQGIDYGPAFRGVTRAWVGTGEALSQLGVPGLDACLQGLSWAADLTGNQPRVPVGIGRTAVHGDLSQMAFAWARWRDGLGQVLVLRNDGQVLAEVEDIAVSAAAVLPSGSLWELAWERADPPAPTQPPGRWLIVGDAGAEIGQRLQARGMEVVVLLSREVDRADLTGVTGVLWLAGADDTERVVSFVQRLEREGFRDLPRLWLVTSGTQAPGEGSRPPGDGTMCVTGSELWGLSQVLRHEHPRLRSTCVDLSVTPTPAELNELANEILTGTSESRIALRGSARYVQRLVAVRSLPPVARLACSPDASYLITGGLGGIGLAVAHRLLARGARHLALVSRRAPSAHEAARVEQLGGGARLFQADVSARSQVERLLADVEESMPPVRGIVHAAGVLDEVTVMKVTPERLRNVMRPKVAGAWNLHECTDHLSLDLFVLCSSAASILGAPGQAGYAAANAYLDALAHYRRSLRKPALAVSWGRWAEVGLAAESSRAAHLADQGIDALAPDDALDTLEALIAGGATQAVPLAIDFRQWSERHPQASTAPVFSLMAGVRRQRPADGAQRALSGNGPELRESRDTIEEPVRAAIESAMRLPARSLAANGSFFALGLDSLTALEIRNRLEAAFDLTLPATIVWHHPTLASLSQALADRLQPARPEPRLEADGDLRRVLEAAAHVEL